jgi:serine/threonine protein kinase
MSDSHQETDREWLNDAGQMLLMLKRAIGESTVEQEIPGYQVLNKIASGAQGTVYQGVKAGSDVDVAIKVLHQRTFPTSRKAMRLQREFDLASRLDHPGLVRIRESGLTESGRPFLVMEMLTGGTLQKAMPLGGDRPEMHGLEPSLHIFLKVCDAVDHAHKRGVLHRDLKPSNVLFDENGNPRVADFGLAKDIHKNKTAVGIEASLTRAGELVGSPAYSAPEQFSLTDENDVDVRSDVYSLGAILYELLCGQLPLSAEGSMLDVLQRLRTERPQVLSKVYREQRIAGALPDDAPTRLPHEFDAVLQMALAKDKIERYQSVADLAADVKAVMEGDSIQARMESRRKAAWRWIKLHRAASFGILAYTTTLLAVSIMSWNFAQRTDTLRLHTVGMNDVVIKGALDSLQRIKGGGRYRENLIRGTLHELDNILREFPDDPFMRESRAKCWVHLGSWQRETGNSEGARISFLKALGDYEFITQEANPNPQYLHGKSIALVKMGDHFKEDEQLEQASKFYDQALEIDKKLVESDKRNIGFLDNLAWSYQRHGDLAAKSKNKIVAGKYAELFGGAVEQLKLLGPDRPSTQRAEISLCSTNVYLSKMNKDQDTALMWSIEAVRIAADSYRKDTSNLDNGIQYVGTLNSLHDMQIGIQLLEDAEKVAVITRKLLAELREMEPDNLDILRLDLHFRFHRLPFLIQGEEGAEAFRRCQDLLAELSPPIQGRPDLVQAAIQNCSFATHAVKGTEHYQTMKPLIQTLKKIVDESPVVKPALVDIYQKMAASYGLL